MAGEITGLPDVLGDRREFRALRDALDALPRSIREKLWAVLRVGRGPLGRRDWDATLAAAAGLSDAEIVAQMLDEADLHDLLRKGLFVLGAARVPGDAP